MFSRCHRGGICALILPALSPQMKTPPFASLVVLLVGLSLTLTACQYPYAFVGSAPRSGTFLPYRSSGHAPLGDLAASTLGSNRDHYYYVIRGANTGTRCYSARPWYATTPGQQPSYPVSYQRHPYYSNSIFSSPYYNRSSSYGSSYTNRPWGGGYGFGQPFGWGTGLGLGSRWF